MLDIYTFVQAKAIQYNKYQKPIQSPKIQGGCEGTETSYLFNSTAAVEAEEMTWITDNIVLHLPIHGTFLLKGTSGNCNSHFLLGNYFPSHLKL